MNTKNILGTLAITTLVATSLAFAQDGNSQMEVSATAVMNLKTNSGMMGRLQGKPSMASNTASGIPWRDMHSDMRGMMASITANMTDSQKSVIAAKIGITIDALNAKLKSGTPLQAIIAGKISREDMMKILPPMMASSTASGTMGVMMRDHGNDDYDQKPQKGFFNAFVNKFFSKRDANSKENFDAGSDVSAQADVNVQGGGRIRNFFKHLFNF